MTRPRRHRRPTAGELGWLASQLNHRDRWLLHMLHEHRILTTHQLARIAFTTRRVANRRLATLYELRVVDRFRPFRAAGSAPAHYTLAPAGAAVLAAEHELTYAEFGYHHDRTLALAHSRRLTHLLGTNDVFTHLIAASRQETGGQLITWWSEHRSATVWGDLARPDGYGRWHHTGAEFAFYLEHDTGTESHTKVGNKLADYAALATATGYATPVLFHLPNPRRETGLRAHFTERLHHLDALDLLPIATTNTALDPAGPAWLPIHHVYHQPPTERLQLDGLATRWPATAPLITAPSDVPAPSPICPPPATRNATGGHP